MIYGSVEMHACTSLLVPQAILRSRVGARERDSSLFLIYVLSIKQVATYKDGEYIERRLMRLNNKAFYTTTHIFYLSLHRFCLQIN